MITRRGVLARALLSALALSYPSARAQTDPTEKKPETAKPVGRVLAAGPPAGVLIYVLAPEKLIGWPSDLRPEERAFIAPPYGDLAYIGRIAGRGSTVPLEKVVELKPDLILDLGSINPTFTSTAERVEKQTGIPYKLLDGRFADSPRMIRRAAELLGSGERGEAVAKEAEAILAEAAAVVKSVQAPPRVYLARGEDGLETGVAGSINTEIIEFVGAKNVAASAGEGRLTRVSPEQILDWNPEVIVTQYVNVYKTVFSDPVWKGLEAVKTKKVYFAPSLPFGWLDGPPGINRLIGVRWLLSKLYGNRASFDLRDATRDFYNRFYHLDLTPAQIDRLLGEG